MMLYSQSPEAATKLLSFLNASPTPWHAVAESVLRLEKAGFLKLNEADSWDNELTPGGKYYFTRNQASLLAFTLPPKWKRGTGMSIVGTHVDSPNLRVRPRSKKTSAGYLQVGVETYGGGIWHTWFDRDLSLAGRVVIEQPGNKFTSQLIKIDRPILRIPSLAIHVMDRDVNSNFKFNQETEFTPILGIVESKLNIKADTSKSSGLAASSIQESHHPVLLSLLSKELSVAAENVRDFELALYDTQPSVLGGIDNEFILSPRLDNLFSSFCAVEAISQFPEGDPDGNVNCIALFNHEEIGSVSTTGAESNLIPSLLARLSPTPETLSQSIAKSFLISSDMSHAVHPNYTSKHEENHKPMINGGVIIKTNAKQRYASDAIGSFIVKSLIEKNGGKVQEYEVRNDMACGSTIGPFCSKMGIRTVDVGCGMLSMHSIRETGGSRDVQSAIDLFSAFFEGFAQLDATLTVG